MEDLSILVVMNMLYMRGVVHQDNFRQILTESLGLSGVAHEEN